MFWVANTETTVSLELVFNFCCNWHGYSRKQKDIKKKNKAKQLAITCALSKRNYIAKIWIQGKNITSNEKKHLSTQWLPDVNISRQHGIDFLCGLKAFPLLFSVVDGHWLSVAPRRAQGIATCCLNPGPVRNWADMIISWELVIIKYWTQTKRWKPVRPLLNTRREKPHYHKLEDCE